MVFFFNDTATTEIYTLSLHDALPILLIVDLDHFKEINDTLGHAAGDVFLQQVGQRISAALPDAAAVCRLGGEDRKSTRLNSSHANISYAVFCLKKQNEDNPAALHVDA